MDIWGQSLVGRGNDKYKDPLMEICLLCPRNSKKIPCHSSVSGAERANERMTGDEAEDMEGEGGSCIMKGFACY